MYSIISMQNMHKLLTQYLDVIGVHFTLKRSGHCWESLPENFMSLGDVF